MMFSKTIVAVVVPFFIATAACNAGSDVSGPLDTEPDTGASPSRRTGPSGGSGEGAGLAPPSSSRDSSAPDASTKEPSMPGDAGDEPSPPEPPPPAASGPCTTAGPVVYGAVDATSAYRYSTSPGFPAGFTPIGPVFRLASSASTDVKTTLYLLGNGANGDYVVTTVPTEGSTIGYGPIAALGPVYLGQVPGTVPLTRYFVESPRLRHRVEIGAAPGGWMPEPPRGFVCPL